MAKKVTIGINLKKLKDKVNISFKRIKNNPFLMDIKRISIGRLIMDEEWTYLIYYSGLNDHDINYR